MGSVADQQDTTGHDRPHTEADKAENVLIGDQSLSGSFQMVFKRPDGTVTLEEILQEAGYTPRERVEILERINRFNEDPIIRGESRLEGAVSMREELTHKRLDKSYPERYPVLEHEGLNFFQLGCRKCEESHWRVYALEKDQGQPRACVDYPPELVRFLAVCTSCGHRTEIQAGPARMEPDPESERRKDSVEVLSLNYRAWARVRHVGSVGELERLVREAPEQLLAIPGLGSKTLKKIEHVVTVYIQEGRHA